MQGPVVSLLLHSFDQGGSGRVAAYLARGFADRGLTVDLVVMARGGPAEKAAVNILGDGFPVRYFNSYSGIRPFDLVRGLPSLVRHLRVTKPSAIVACANNVALLGAVAVSRSGLDDCKFYIKTTNPIAGSRHRGIARAIRLASYDRVFHRSAAVWTLSPEESEEMSDAFPAFAKQFTDVANPYVTDAMLAPPDGSIARRQDKIVITVARLTAQKRLDRLLQAFAKVRTPGARLVILGEGEERTTLRAMVSTLGLEDRVEMPGFVSDVATALHHADLFVLTSAYEGLPAVVLEAMATNCPVLTTDCFPAARALVGSAEGCAVVSDGDDSNALAMLIDRNLDQPRPTQLRAIAQRFSIASGIASHFAALHLNSDPLDPTMA